MPIDFGSLDKLLPMIEQKLGPAVFWGVLFSAALAIIAIAVGRIRSEILEWWRLFPRLWYRLKIRRPSPSHIETPSDQYTDLVAPFLKSAFRLSGYGGTEPRPGKRHYVLTPSSPPYETDYDRYQENLQKEDFGFNFGVWNGHEKIVIRDVSVWVSFLDKGLRVEAIGANPWRIIEPNETYFYHFDHIKAQEGLNGDGVLRVHFPDRGTYTIQIDITAADLPKKTYTWLVRLR